MSEKYKDIINLPHHVSSMRKHMSNHDRAAQFAPFAALTGFEDVIDEKNVIYEEDFILDEYEIEKIESVLHSLQYGDEVQAEYYSDGRYENISGQFIKLSIEEKTVSINDTVIPLNNLRDIRKS